MTTKTTNNNPWLMDSRVRERNLKSGALTEKELEKQLAALPDLEGQYDAVATPQPALEQPRVAAPIVEESDSDLGEDEDEDESSDDLGDESTPDVADVGGGGGNEPSGDVGGGDAGVVGGGEPSEGGGEA